MREKARRGQPAPLPEGEEPESDAITQHIFDVFMMVNRSRRYAVGLGGAAPLPLSVADITAVLDAHPSPLSREELDACIFALDAEFMAGDEEAPEPQEDVESAWRKAVGAINGD